MEFHDLAELLLDFSENCMPVESIHGMLTAICISPKPVQPVVWLPLIFGRTDELPSFSSEEQKEKILQSLSDMERDVIMSLANRTWSPLILGIQETRKIKYDAGPWASGFILGVNLERELWLKDKQVFDSLMPVFFLAYPEQYKPALQKHSEGEIESMRNDFMDELSDLIPGIYHYWLAGAS